MSEKNEKMRIKKSTFKSIKWLSALVFFLLLVFTLNQIKKTSSLFKDEAVVEGITFSTGYWSEEEDEEEIEPGDVVINEIMWMGSDVDEKDEWIELRNMTDEEIDISNWRIEGLAKGAGEKAHLQIPNGYSIEANGYFLILSKKWNKTAINLDEDLDKSEGMTNKASMDISDEGEKLELVDQNWQIIDTAWKDNEEWPAGEDGEEKRSMQRNLDPKDGQNSDNWFSCLDENCNKEKFWKESEGNNYGTPGEENLFNFE
jgi:hypothetical protein